MTLFESTSRQRFLDLLDERAVFWVSDPGHAWLAVPLAEVRRAGITEDISHYSYLGSGRAGYAGYALLEEDCDASLYVATVTDPAWCETLPEFTFGQRGSSNVAYDVRHCDAYTPDSAERIV